MLRLVQGKPFPQLYYIACLLTLPSELLEQQKMKVAQLEAEIEGLRARETQVSKAKLDNDARSKRKRVIGE
jgi:hypothetical protein